MKKISMFSVFIILSIIFIACGKKEKSAKNVLRINITTDISTLDSRKARDMNTQMVLRMLGEGLTRIGPDGQPKLALAESYDISNDLRTYTFYLKESVWSDGKKFTANDFLYTFESMLDPAFPSDLSSQLFVIQGAMERKQGKGNHLGVKVLDDRTLEITLKDPVPYFLELVSTPAFLPVPATLDKKDPNWASNFHVALSNGPFMIANWVKGDRLELKKNPKYWDAEKVRLNGIDMCMVAQGATSIAMFEQGELDWEGSPFGGIPGEKIQDPKYQGLIHFRPSLGTFFIRVNTTHPGLNHPKVRKALALALNRKALTEHVTQGGQLPAFALVPPELGLSGAYFSDGGSKEIVEEAKKLLSEAGFPEGKGFPPITLSFAQAGKNNLLSQAIQDEWREVLGIQVGLKSMDRKVWIDNTSSMNYDLSFGAWNADFADPIDFLGLFKTQATGRNNTGWESNVYQSLIESSNEVSDVAERKALLGSAEAILMAEMPIIPIYYYTMIYLKNPHLHNVWFSSLGIIDFKEAYFSQ